MARSNLPRMIRKAKTNRRRSASAKRRTQKRRTQQGGVGFRPDVATGCKIGGLPVINATSDCPDVGPGDNKFAKALYGAGRKQRKPSCSKNKYSKSKSAKKSKSQKK
jgi:hypothetical protein